MKNIEKTGLHILFSKEGKKEYQDYLRIMNFKDNSEFNDLLGKLVFFREETVFLNIISKIENSIKETLKMCKEAIGEEKLNIFIFETKDPFITSEMSGSSGFCTGKNCIILLINLEFFKELALKNTIAHEIAHAINSSYDMGNMSIGQGLIFDGLAENFRESIIDNKKSILVSKIDKDESLRLFTQIKPLLESKNIEDYRELFFYNKKYPLWAGYAIGYNLVKDYLKKQNSLNWFNILRKDPEIILKEILKN